MRSSCSTDWLGPSLRWGSDSGEGATEATERSNVGSLADSTVECLKEAGRTACRLAVMLAVVTTMSSDVGSRVAAPRWVEGLEGATEATVATIGAWKVD